MLTKNIFFKNFQLKKNSKKIEKDFILLLKEENKVIKSLGNFYKNNYNKEIIEKLKKYTNFRILGMGGSILGAESIFSFLSHKIKKKFNFINSLNYDHKLSKKKIYKLNNLKIW